MKSWILTILALALTACVPVEGETEQEPVADSTSGSSGSSGNSGSDDFCFTPISAFWCDGSSGSTASAVHSQISDTEPNDNTTNAVSVHWPRNTSTDQRIGFGVEGHVSAADDVADFFAFTPRRSADFNVGLCETGQTCGPWNADYRLPLTIASVRILDQFGSEILSETLYPGSANAFEAHFESGVLYYAVVVAEGISGHSRPYQLSVGEAVQ